MPRTGQAQKSPLAAGFNKNSRRTYPSKGVRVGTAIRPKISRMKSGQRRLVRFARPLIPARHVHCITASDRCQCTIKPPGGHAAAAPNGSTRNDSRCSFLVRASSSAPRSSMNFPVVRGAHPLAFLVCEAGLDDVRPAYAGLVNRGAEGRASQAVNFRAIAIAQAIQRDERCHIRHGHALASRASEHGRLEEHRGLG